MFEAKVFDLVILEINSDLNLTISYLILNRRS